MFLVLIAVAASKSSTDDSSLTLWLKLLHSALKIALK